MASGNKILIGIQARSTSKRFPRKSFADLEGKPLLQHVINACNKAAEYHNKHSHKTRSFVNVAVLVPTNDEIVGRFSRSLILEGSENDVLSRYYDAATKMDSSYIVRVTGDCPLIPPYLISKFIKTAEINSYDYLSNIDENIRTALDGIDCEVISKRALEWMHKNAVDAYDREHVTPLIRKSPPEWCKVGHVVGYFDHSNLKLSVDTPEDLERVRTHLRKTTKSVKDAEAKYGPNCTHRF